VLLGAIAPAAFSARTDLPNPCQLVSTSLIASVLGTKHPPTGMLASVTNVSTCTFGRVLSISVGYTAITNPAAPATELKIAGIPGGLYETYTGSKQTEVTFIKGSAATGVYAVIRNFGKIPKTKLERVAVAVYKALGSASGSAPGGGLIP
jgi:hypothetical protein